ncbi:Transcriptional regulator, PadR family [Candidatus Nitrosotalea sp. TS]|uniref:PadR family transcriptional regulator n=1 Tax=Candidatus Nitrosotalea sp. TS TaxID=2341020 RepID=UPI00140E5584|nr:PadR family transcriptional regulator [Candidatus Nitrosotalea sp. TS]NHI03444.1 Transcriptional regulator, PadR family [Candidatus Nitrosotalea sp. TS]
MISDWFQRVGSSIPRGFSRYFILEALKKKPSTGKEIIDAAIAQSEGKWKPSPGLIYPLLGRLLDEGLVEETKDGKYQITKKGRIVSDDLESLDKIVKNQLDVIFRMGDVGKFIAMDLIERINTIGTSLSSNISYMTKDETQKYRKFLESELRKMDLAEKKSQGKEIKIN